MAQTFNYTDASGVTATYQVDGNSGVTFPDGVTMQTVSLANIIISAPAGLTKWVLPETVVDGNGVTYRLYGGVIHGEGYNDGYVFSNLTELVLPRFMRQFQSFNATPSGTGQFPNLTKVTFGEYYQYFGGEAFQGYPLDSVIFKGTAIFYNLATGNTYGNQQQTFGNNPTTTKIIIPCGTRELFELSMTNYPQYWNRDLTYGSNVVFWTTANLVEAECLNTLTVLSSDVSKGHAYSFAGCGFVTTTPDNTSANHSGNITLLALPKGGVVFLGWADGNLDNPRTVNVASDTTFTANFATCTETGIRSVQAAAPMKVYPNPAKNELNVELERAANGTLALFDLSGRVVETRHATSLRETINIAHLAQGTYILRIVENGTASAGVKVVKE
ncbi:MAG: T9SS type A sorting domain-containing protein [Bacteroidales bacterium]|jgi:hypothetical protein|nr:T9SS type A sorting domain-containing protein [Bacteroidales bacterium]